MRRVGQSKWRHFRAYGGPEDGAIVMIPRGADWHVARRTKRDRIGFDYVLVSDPAGGHVLVPRRDCELVAALRAASLDGNAVARDALAVEVERRGLGS